MTRSAAAVREQAGERIRTARLNRGLTVRALATTIHVSPATVTAIEHGRTSITLERLESLAAALDASPADLIGAETAEPAEPPLRWREFTPLDLDLDPALAGAARAFLSTGYHGATMRSIAHAAGISPAGIYHHYASKHDLLRELMLRGLGDLVWRVDAAAEETRDPLARLSVVVEAVALWHARRFEIALIGASEMRSLDAAAHRQAVLVRRRVQHRLDQAFLGALPPGADRREGLDAARAVATMCTSIPQWFKSEGEMSAEEVARQHARFALRLAGRGDAVEPGTRQAGAR